MTADRVTIMNRVMSSVKIIRVYPYRVGVFASAASHILFKMDVSCTFSALVVLTVTTLSTQNVANRDGISLPRRKRVAKTNSTCATQKLLQLYSPTGAILKPREGRNNSFFYVGEKAVFVCKSDYRKINQPPSFTCQDDSTWKEDSAHQTAGFCVVRRCNVEVFSCKTGNTKIDACKQCDCISDCSDSSDEVSCKHARCTPMAWNEVDSLDPNGLILSQDPTYSPTIKIPTTKKRKPLPPLSTPTLAIVLLALILFVVASFVACKLGKRIIGPRCSFGYCLALVLRRPFPPESPSHSAETSLEERPLRLGHISTSFTREEAPNILQATYLEDEADVSLRGSSENII